MKSFLFFSFLFGERNQNCCAWHVLGVGGGSWRGHFGNPALEFLDLFVRTEEQVADGDATKEKARSTCSCCWFAREGRGKLCVRNHSGIVNCKED